MPNKDLKQLLERIHLRLDESFVGIGAEITDLPTPDLAELLNELTVAEASTVVSMLPVPRAVELFDQPAFRRRSAIIGHQDPQRAAQILDGISADERTDVMQKLGLHERHRILPKLNPAMRAELEHLLQYPVHTAGGIMTTEFVRLDPAMTVAEALKHIRSVARDKESIYACYVMEPGTGRLLGAVSLRDLVMAELETPVTNVMRRKPVTVNAQDDQEAVAK
jgi:magnesium transporter